MRRLEKELLWPKLCSPTPNSYVEVLNPVLQNVAVFVDVTYKDVIEVKCGNMGRPNLI